MVYHLSSLYVSFCPDSVDSLVNDLVLSLMDNLSKPVNCIGLSWEKFEFFQTSCEFRDPLCLHVMHQMQLCNGGECQRCFEGCKRVLWVRIILFIASKDERAQFSHTWKKKTVRCFKCKNCIMSLLVISVVPLWMKILIRWFCTLKIFHLIYNL